MPRGVRLTVDQFVAGAVRFLQSKSPDAREIILQQVEQQASDEPKKVRRMGKRKMKRAARTTIPTNARPAAITAKPRASTKKPAKKKPRPAPQTNADLGDGAENNAQQ